MAGVAIACRGLVKGYGAGEARVAALSGVDLDVFAGEVVLLAGPSGCGKTTLLSIIATLLDADVGDVSVAGTPIRGLDRAARAELRGRRLGFVFQSFNLLPALTARQNVGIPLLLSGHRPAAAERLADAALTAVGLAERGGHLPGQLSGGQQQRVAIARAIVHQPAVLLCDEPTSALDHDTGQQIMTLLRDQARTLGAALLVVTHDPRIEPFADRIVRMEDGRIRDEQMRAAA